MWKPNWPKCDILHICIMRKLLENCVHSFVKNPMNFMNLKGLFLQPVTLLAVPRGARWRAGHRQWAKPRIFGRGGGVQKGFFIALRCTEREQ